MPKGDAKEGRMQVSWWIEEDLALRLIQLAERRNVFQRELVEEIFGQYLDRAEAPQPMETT
jgi:hypothetical protein